ncbi:MAG TPA: RNA-binding cell elongation regulator Jag/EloR [Anaerolineales bacterium]|nr:RNA-binding cell elongation regulator Jag/EloR [Anaerolineales bacterium]
MTERTTLEIIAPTVEEALAQGLAQLGLTADAVSVEVLDAGNKGLFGFGKHQVRIRLTVNPPGGEPEIRTVAAATESEPKASIKTPEKLVAGKQTESQPQPEHDPMLDHTEAVVSKLLHLLNLEAQVSAHYGASERDGRHNINVDVRGNDLSILIGRRSETLSAFQYVASLIIGKETGQFVQLTVDVEGYRGRREKQLIQMAKRMAEQVAKSGRRQTLEPMPSDERRIIHIALRDHPDVTTESTGDDPYRKVTIIPKNA